MKALVLVTTLITLLVQYSHQVRIREVAREELEAMFDEQFGKKSSNSIVEKYNNNQFIEEQLIQHTQALEHLLKMTESIEDQTKALVENFSNDLALKKPKSLEKLEVPTRPTRRANVEDEPNPFTKLGKNIPKYSILFTDILYNRFHNKQDPTVLVQHDVGLDKTPVTKSFTSRNLVPYKEKHKDNVDHWCSVAAICHRTNETVCGLDDVIGYAKFEDVCHMLHVNCYWKYKFSVVPSCELKL